MIQNNSKNNLLFISEQVINDYSDYLLEENISTHNLVNERKYTVKDTGVAYRVINNWNEKDILLSSFRDIENGWRKFNFTEIVWLEVVKKLRDFGLSLEFIKKVKDNIVLKSDKNNNSSWFEYHIVKTKISAMDSYVVLLTNGTTDLLFSRDIETNKILFGSRSMILISIKEVLSSLGINVKGPESLISLSNPEREIITTIRTSDFDSVSIKKRNGKITSINKTKTIMNPNNKSIRDQIEEYGGFAEVITQYTEGRENSATITEKKKL